MKKKTKEISVFSMSAIDLFCSALGAFMVIAMIAMPHYMKRDPMRKTLNELRQELESVQKELVAEIKQSSSLDSQIASLEDSIARKQLAQAKKEEELEELENKLDETFILVFASWTEDADIDLYIEDPAHRGYYFKKKTHSGVNASLAEDSKRAGIEIFETPNAQKGTYEFHLVCYNNYSSNNVDVNVRLYYKSGKLPLKSATLNNTKNYSFTYKLDVGDNGDINSTVYEKRRTLTKTENGFVNKTSPWN